jgi:hypothetical protein
MEEKFKKRMQTFGKECFIEVKQDNKKMKKSGDKM